MFIALIVVLVILLAVTDVRGHGLHGHDHDHDEVFNHPGAVRTYKAVHRNQTITVDASIFHDKAKLVNSPSRCATRHPEREEATRLDEHLHASLAARGVQMDSISMQDHEEELFPIPVYWHRILPDDGSEGRITKKMINKSIKKLNKAFRMEAFELISVITTRNSEWFYMTQDDGDELEAKTALRRGGPNALNIYSCRPDYEFQGNFFPLLGFATFPWWYEDDPSLDGVVIQYDTVPGGGNPDGFGEGDTLTHEVGHWLGLFHVFQGNSCSSNGDQVGGTAFQRTPTFGCPATKDSCPNKPGEDNIHNFMDYSDDVCLTNFHNKQLKRMAAMMYYYRSGLA